MNLSKTESCISEILQENLQENYITVSEKRSSARH
jgi:hypothetical protein